MELHQGLKRNYAYIIKLKKKTLQNSDEFYKLNFTWRLFD